MRHYFCLAAVAPHSFGMLATAFAGILVAPSRGQDRLAPGRLRAIATAIALAAVAGAANAYLLAATGAQE